MPLLHKRGFKIEVAKDDQTPYVSFNSLDEIMSRSERTRFSEWMRGQTAILDGVFPWDLERFLAGRSIID